MTADYEFVAASLLTPFLFSRRRLPELIYSFLILQKRDSGWDSKSLLAAMILRMSSFNSRCSGLRTGVIRMSSESVQLKQSLLDGG
jgi:hypothetical protein